MRLLFPVFLCTALLPAAFTRPLATPAKDPQPVSLGEFLYRVNLVKEQSLVNAQTKWWHEYLEYPVNHAFFRPIFDGVRSGKITAFKPVYPFTEKMSQEEAAFLLAPVDSIYVEDLITGEASLTPVSYPVETAHVTGVIFHEEWLYDEASLTLQKNVKGMILEVRNEMLARYRPDGQLMYIPFFSPGSHIVPGSDIVAAEGITYDFSVETEVKGASTEESFNAFGRKASLNGSLTKVAASPKTKLYDTIYPFTRRLNKKTAAARSRLIREASIMRFMEDWLFDPVSMKFSKTVRGVLLIAPLKSSSRPEPMAFLPLNKIIPVSPFPAGPVKIDSIGYAVHYRFPSYKVPDGRLRGDSAALAKFVYGFADQARAHQFKSYPPQVRKYSPFRNVRIPYSDAELDHIFTWKDTSVYMDPYTEQLFDTVLTFGLAYGDFSGLRFYESWSFDPGKMHFEKEVRAIGPTHFTENDDIRWYTTLFYGETQPFTPAVAKPANLVGKHIRTSVKLAPGEPEASWSYYSAVFYSDVPMRDVYPSQRYRMIQPVIEQALAGKLVVYEGADTTKPLTPAAVRAKLDALKDSSYVEGDLGTAYTLVNEFIFDEDWYYDAATQQFYKKVNAVTFVHRRPDNTEDQYHPFEVEMPVFTVKMR